MKKQEGLIVARFKEGESVMSIADDLQRTAIFVEGAIRAYLLLPQEEKPQPKKKGSPAMKTLLVLSALLFASPAFATCPGNASCGTGVSTTSQSNLVITFPSGTATLVTPWQWDGDVPGDTTETNPAHWNADGYGTVSYDDGEIAYSGAARFLLEICNSSDLPAGYQCTNRGFIVGIKVQSCTASHVLTSRFIAFGTDQCIAVGSCPHANSVNVSISGF